MRFKLQALTIALAAVSTLVVVPAEAEPTEPSIRTTEVSFTVQNVNRSKLACPSDGATYRVVGNAGHSGGGPRRHHAVDPQFHREPQHLPGPDPRLPLRQRDGQARPRQPRHRPARLRQERPAGRRPPGLPRIGGGRDVPGDGAPAQLETYEGDAHPAFEKVAVGGFSIGAWQAELIGVSFPNVDGIIPIGGMSGFVHPEAAVDVSQQHQPGLLHGLVPPHLPRRAADPLGPARAEHRRRRGQLVGDQRLRQRALRDLGTHRRLHRRGRRRPAPAPVPTSRCSSSSARRT